MMNLFIFGAGQMGQAASKYARDLGHTVTVLDVNRDNLNTCYGQKNYLQNNWTDELELLSLECDGVVSCLPYFLNEKLAKECIKRQIPYFDLGGVLSVTAAIEKANQENKYKSIVFQNLGLAPGLCEILAEEVYSKFIPDSLDIYVGGIPEYTIGRYVSLNYKLVWSLEGLLNNYRDRCEILRDGEIIAAEALSGLTTLRVLGYTFEAFNTSGGAPNALISAQRHGVQNFKYQTIRWPHHVDCLKLLETDELRKQFLLKSSEEYSNVHDCVIIHVEASSYRQSYTRSYWIPAKDGVSAMGRATAIPLISAVDAVLQTINRRNGFAGNSIQFLAECPKFWANLERLKLL